MFECEFCGRWAGFFKTAHPECEEKSRRSKEAEAQEGAKRIEATAYLRACISSCVSGAITQDSLFSALDGAQAGEAGLISDSFTDWLRGVAGPNSNAPLPSDAMEGLVSALKDRYALQPARIPEHLWDRFVRLCAIRDILEGKIPDRVKFDSNLPFLLEEGEAVAWAFPGTSYLEDRVVKSQVRGYTGLSVRLVPGVYAHTGASAPISTEQGFVTVDGGLLALSDRAILFHGSHKSLRFKYKEIATLQRVDYGFIVCKGTQTARNIAFETQEVLPGFPYAMLQGLAQMTRSDIRRR